MRQICPRWSPGRTCSVGGDAGVVVWECISDGSDAVASVYTATHAALDVLQSWLGQDRAATLVVLTHGGVGLPGEDITDLAAAAVWGLVRSAQGESDGRIVLIDTDTAVDVALLADVGEAQLLVRGGTVHGARLFPIAPLLALPAGESAWRLVAGGGGTLQDLVFQPCPAVQCAAAAGARAGSGVSRGGQLPRRGGGTGDVSRPGAPAGCRRCRGGDRDRSGGHRCDRR